MSSKETRTRCRRDSFRSVLAATLVGCVVLQLCFTALAHSPAWGEERYHRKAVAAVRSVAVTDKSVTLSSKQRGLFAQALEKHLLLPRFDQAVLPGRIQGQLDTQIQGRTLSDADLQRIVDQTVVPEFVRILQVTLEERAHRDTPEDRQKFITIKAKEIGVTAEDVERMMQCAYLYVPYLSKARVGGGGDAVRAEISGGLHWYHLSLTGANGPHVEKVGHVQASARTGAGSWGDYLKRNKDALGESAQKWSTFGKSLGFGRKAKDIEEKRAAEGKGAPEEDLPAELQAFRNASNLLAVNLSVKTSDAFPWARLMAPIVDVDGSRVFFRLGAPEGLTIDDRYEIISYYEDEQGREFEEKVGHCMLSKVSDNLKMADAKSMAKTVIGGGDVTMGMWAREVARMGIDLSIRPAWHPVDLNCLASEHGFSLVRATDNGAYGSDVNLEMDFGRRAGMPQLYFTVGGGYGYVPVDVRFAAGSDTADVSRAHLVGIHLGLMKRHYLGRVAVRLGAEYGWSRLLLSHTTDSDERHTLSEHFTPLRANLGFEVALSTNANFGFYGGYQWPVGPADWRLEVGDSESPVSSPDFDVDHEGIYGGLVFTYALPSLGWSPF